jgi:serine/threonine protein kinase/Flp pilus assembly protein TadD
MLTTKQSIRNQQLADVTGQDSNEFRVLQVIRGGMGTCAKVQGESGAIFALKCLELEDANQEAYDRFRREVEIWATAASCEVVVDVYGVIRINEIPAVCSSWMEGGDLSRLMSSADPKIFYVTLDRIIAGLEWVYQKYNIIHRDIKPANILLDSAGRPFITDWGIGKVAFEDDATPVKDNAAARMKPSSVSEQLTQTGRLLGTIPYCSPEQVLGSRTIDFRSDIYSLGCLIYQWETGVVPFSGSTWQEVARKHLDSPVPKIGGIFTRSRLGADEAIYRSLEKKPEDRYGSYQEFRKALRNFALKRKIDLPIFEAKPRRPMPLVGHDQFARLKPAVTGTRGWGLFELEDIKPHIAEAEVLCAAGEWQKAYDILSRFWHPELSRTNLGAYFAINMGHCLVSLGRANEAIEVMRAIPSSQELSAEYYLNLGDAFLHAKRFKESEEVSRQGLKAFSNDQGIIGNLTISLNCQDRRTEALPFALKRLELGRDVHSLEEAANVLSGLGRDLLASNAPKGFEYLRQSASLCDEALHLNPLYHNSRNNLAITLFDLDLLTEALDTAASLPSDRFWSRRKVVLHAKCLNRTAAVDECLEFCAKWIKQFPEEVELQRAQAEIIADFRSIGYETKDGARIIVPECVDFFTKIVKNTENRKPSDFGHLARLLHWWGRPDEARDTLLKDQSIYGDKWEVLFDLAWLHWTESDLNTAYAISKRACLAVPWLPKVWEQRSFLEGQLGVPVAKNSQLKADDLKERIKSLRNATLNYFHSLQIVK